eukprot:CAMPEP_0206208920 /NCGR_PEP_ID=MMETSP0166-20121206/16575_1 /ASSEMBLY_ACC=CAM_ASM_000260 /TAXON_ID=95228 /ORGANISM="Vannella robusta, Strain DIVA3 518/3/11/1/6" /LENGTH=134 /DNA_ID=CAMNT_0053630167 /DNA_START=234 /DNA_END=635 /DNA_ORIENTATION=+
MAENFVYGLAELVWDMLVSDLFPQLGHLHQNKRWCLISVSDSSRIDSIVLMDLGLVIATLEARCGVPPGSRGDFKALFRSDSNMLDLLALVTLILNAVYLIQYLKKLYRKISKLQCHKKLGHVIARVHSLDPEW